MSELITLIKTNFLIGLNSFRTQNNSQKIGSSAVTVILGALGIFLSVYGNIMLYNLYKEAPVPMFALIVMCVALLLIMFTSFMKVKGTLFGSKDYEMLKALPIKKSSILTAKLVDIYFSEFKFSLLALLPTLVIICMYYPSVLGILIIISAIFFLPAFPILVFGILSILTHLVFSKFKYGTLVSSILYMAIFVGIYLLIYIPNDDQKINIFNNTAEVFKYAYFPLLFVRDALIDGSVSGLFIYLGINIALLAIAGLLFVLTYDAVNRLSESKKYKAYSEMEYKVEGVTKALIKKDFSYIFSSFQLMINSLIGPVMSIVMIFIANMSSKANVEDPETARMVTLYVGSVMIPMIAFMYGITPYTSFAFAGDSKTFWIVKTLPLRSKDVVLPKIIVSLILTTPFAIAAGIIAGFVYELDVVSFILTPIFLIIFNLFVTILGTVFNMRKPLQNYKTEVEAIKRGGSTLYMMLTSLLAVAIFITLSIVFVMFVELYLAIIIDIVLALAGLITSLLILQNNMDRWYYNLYC